MFTKVKKLISASICVPLILSAFSGCTLGKKSVSLIIRAPIMTLIPAEGVDDGCETVYDFLSAAAEEFCKQYSKADVTVKVEQFDLSDEDAYISDCFDTEYAADVLFEGYFNSSAYVYSGHAVPLDDVITDKLRGDIYDELWDSCTVDGKTYFLPFYSMQNILFYNKDLFRQAGLDEYISDEDEIQSWTIEEWECILDSLAASLPENSFPMMMYGKNDLGDTHIMTLIRGFDSDFYDGNGNFHVSCDDGIEALEWIKQGRDRGWFPTKCESLDINDCVSLFVNDQLAIFLGNNVTIKTYEDMDLGFVNFPEKDGGGLCTSWDVGFEILDNGDPDKIEVSKDFLRFLYGDEKWTAYSTGGVPVLRSTADKYKNSVRMIDEFSENSVNNFSFMGECPNWREIRNVFYPHIQGLLSGSESAEEAAKGIDKDCNAVLERGRTNMKLHE